MKVCLTGSTGYLGSVLLPNLIARGHKVRVLLHKKNMIYSDKRVVDILSRHPDSIEMVWGDLRKKEDLSSYIGDSECIIHLAAVVGDQACLKNHTTALQVNYTASRNLFEAASGKRIIFASTCSIYGATKKPVTEEAEPMTPDYYSITKLGAETALAELSSNYVIFRFGTLYGLSPSMRFDLVVNRFMAQAIQDKKLTLYGGNQFRPFLNVHDAVSYIIKALDRGQGLYNLGGVNYRMHTMAVRIADLLDDRLTPSTMDYVDVEVLKDMADKRDYIVDSAKARKEFDGVFMDEVQQETMNILEEYRSGRIKDYHDPEYDNSQKDYS